MVRMGDGSPQVWYTIVEEMEARLQHLEFQGDDIQLDWRKAARRNRIHREVHEKYGHFKDIILDPRFQMAKQYLEDNANFDIAVDAPLLPTSALVILLFMMHKRVSNSILGLIAAFLLNFNPLYVSLVVVFLWLSRRRPSAPAHFQPPPPPPPPLLVDSSHKKRRKLSAAAAELRYEYVLVGGNISTLYTAALLSKCGHSCCVLQPSQLDQITIHPEGAPCGVPASAGIVSKAERYQRLLDVVQAWDEDRVAFVPLGSAEDGFTSALLRVLPRTPAPAAVSEDADAATDTADLPAPAPAPVRTLHVRVGEQALIADLIAQCPQMTVEAPGQGQEQGQSLGELLGRLKSIMVFVSGLLAQRIISQEWGATTQGKSEGYTEFFNLCGRSLAEALKPCGGIADIGVLSALAAVVGCGEALAPEQMSGLCLGTALAASETGRFVPAGGVGKVEEALVACIQSHGGAVYEKADVRGLLLDKSSAGYDATGVSVSVGEQEVSVFASKAVVSGLGVLSTYLNLLPADALQAKDREQLAGLQEARPRMLCIFWIAGSVQKLGLSSVEYFEVQPGGPLLRIWCPSAMGQSQGQGQGQDQGRDVCTVIVEVEVMEPLISLRAVQWGEEADAGPRIWCSADAETDPNHQDFAARIGRRLHLSARSQDEQLAAARIKLQQVYPRCTEVLHCHLELPVLGGHRLACTSAKYANPFRARSSVGNLFLTGPDLATNGMMGEMQAGWVTASSILGYTLEELENGKNIIIDLQQVQQTQR